MAYAKSIAELTDKQRSMIAPAERKALGRAAMTNADADEKQLAKIEDTLRNQVLGLLATREIEACSPHSKKKSRIKIGWPDVTFAYHGVPVVWELKTDVGRLSKEQEDIAPKLKANGWQYRVIRSLAEAKAHLDEIDAIGGIAPV